MDNLTKWTQIFEDFRRSELSGKDYCEQHGIVYRTFSRWASRLNFDVRRKGWLRGQHPHSQQQLKTLAPAKHSVYSFAKTGLVPCDGCLWKDECEHYAEGESCKVLAEFQSAKMQELMDLPHIKPEDAPMVEMAVREMAIQALIMRYTSKVGIFHETKDGGKGMQPVMSQYWCSVNALGRILSKLGLDPVSRKQLNIGTGEAFNLAQAIVEAE